MTRITFIAAVAAASLAFASEKTTTVESTAHVPVEHDGCLDHTVRELGMSAKQRPGERVWNIGPQFLHPSLLENGKVNVRIEKGEKVSTVYATATWPGGLKPDEAQAEIEQRLTSMTSMMSLACGAPPRSSVCNAQPSGSPAAACKHAP